MLQYIIINVVLGGLWLISWVLMIISAIYCGKLSHGDSYVLTSAQATNYNSNHSGAANPPHLSEGDPDPYLASAYTWAVWNVVISSLILGLIILGTIALIGLVVFFSVGTAGVADEVAGAGLAEEAVTTVATGKPTISAKVFSLILLIALLILMFLTLINGTMSIFVTYYLTQSYNFTLQDHNYKYAYNSAIASAFLNMGVFGIVTYALLNDIYELIVKHA